jgi:hypothetical protein
MEQIQTLREYMAIMDTEADTFELEERAPYIYRVQLASTQNLEQARTIEEHALQTFEEEVIVQFDSPFYKIRVGRMNNREDAQSLQRMAIETGYRRSWVIRTVNAPIQKDRVEEDVRTQ